VTFEAKPRFWDFSYETTFETVLDKLIMKFERYKRLFQKGAFLEHFGTMGVEYFIFLL